MSKNTRSIQKLKSTKFNPLVMAVFAAALAVAGYFIIFSHAAPNPPTIYLNPASQTVGPNGTVTIDVRENSSTTTVNALQANFTYPTTLLTFVSADYTGSAFSIQAESSGASGQVKIGRGTTTPVSGDQLVAHLTFQASTTGGAATMAFNTGTALVSSTTNADILGSLTATGGGTYTVDTAPPTVSVTAPANNSTVALGTTPTLSATATDASSAVTKVEFYVDGALFNTDTTSPYSATWTTGVTAGAHTIQAKAYDTFNNVATSSLVNVTVADQTAPTVALTAPATGSFVSGATVAVTANSSDNVGVVGVQFKLDGVNLGTEDTTSPYSTTWNTSGATNAAHTLTAVARDAAGNTTTSTSVSTTVDNAAPTVSITSPTNFATVFGTVAVNATATDNTGGSGISKVEFYVDGTLSSTDTTSPYSFSWNTTGIQLGSLHTLTAKAYDNVTPANVITSSVVNVTVQDTTPPSTPGTFHTTTVLPTSVSLAWTASTDNIGISGYWLKINGVHGVNDVTNGTTTTFTYSGLTPNTTYTFEVAGVDTAANFSAFTTPISVTTLSLKSGDINQDNAVDLTDLSLLISSYGSSTDACVTSPTFTCGLTSPAGVDIFDLSVLLSHYGT
jgi:hypothetical protein